MTLFEKKVYQTVRKIPKGRVSTYKLIARIIGNPKACQAVGNTLHRNIDKKIPCHRVIRSSKEIGGYRKGKREKVKLLRQEGVIIINEHIDERFIWP